MKRRKKNRQTDIPYHVIESLARCLLPDIQAYFESEDGKREFAEWQRRQEKENQEKGTKP